jgi:hypothetical protein
VTRYAEKTSVASDRSRAEIEKTLVRYGADQFMYGWQENKAVVGFRMEGRTIKFILPMPDRAAREFTHTPNKGQRRSEDAVAQAFEQAIRQRWRALSLVIKAKLEAVETGITVFDDEFLAHIVLPDGQTVGQFMRPQIDIAYDKGDMPPLLPDYRGES